MLCPAHSSARFPNENSKSRKNLLSKDHDMPAMVYGPILLLYLLVPKLFLSKILCFGIDGRCQV